MSWLSTIFGLGRLRLVDDSGPVQRGQVDQGAWAGGVRRLTDNVPIVGAFGFGSVAPIGAEVLVARCGDDRAQSVGIATNHQPSRPRGLKPGDAVVYDVRGRAIRLDADGMTIDAKGGPVTIVNASAVTIRSQGKVRIEAPSIECTGDLVSRADGAPVSLNDLRDAYAAHIHTGVQAGSGKSAGPDKKA